MTHEEYYKTLAERYKLVDWNSLESIRAYNEFARMLRKQLDEED